MDKLDLDTQRSKYEVQSLGMKLLVWLIGFSIIAIIACVILAIMRVAIYSMVITAGVLVLVVLACIVGYNFIKLKLQEHEYRRQLEKQSKNDDSAK